jgi:hypothetical protein
LLPSALLLCTVTPFRVRVPWLKMAPPSADLPEPRARPFCSVRFCNVSDPPLATSNRRNAGVPEAVLRSMVSPLPAMVSLSFLAMTGSPVGPSVVLFTAVNWKVVLATSVRVFEPPCWLEALMS